MVLQDPSGIAPHNLKLAELWEKELKPSMSHFLGLDNMPQNTMRNVVRHVTENPLLSLREVVGLRNPEHWLFRNTLSGMRSLPSLMAPVQEGARVTSKNACCV